MGVGGTNGTGGTMGVGGTNGTGGTVTGADTATFAAYCAHYKECDPFRYALLYDDDAACTAARALEMEQAAATPDIGMTQEVRRACYAATIAASCETVFLGLPIPQCAIVPGKRSAGAGCFSNGQCSSLDCGVASSSATCGTCQTGASRGASCTDKYDCDGALLCVNSTCGDPGLVGQSCVTSSDCAGALMCLSGTCAAPLAVGDSCTSTAACGFEASCVGGICQQDALAAIGSSCGSRLDGSYAQCAGRGVCSSGRCVEPRPIGQSCSTSGPACMDSGHCVGGICKAFDPTLCPADGGGSGTGGASGSGGSTGGTRCVLSSCHASGFTYSCGSSSYTSTTRYNYSSSGVLIGTTTTVNYGNGNTVTCQSTGSSGYCSGSGNATCVW
jgi:hypothetical protein